MFVASMSVVGESTVPSSVVAERDERQRRTDSLVSCLQRSVPGSVEHAQLVDDLIAVNLPMARTLASRYRDRGVDSDDLEQVAMVGLIKAANRFDASAGFNFMVYAVPTIRGELRRHFRDAGWMVRPPRRVQELRTRIARTRSVLENRLGRSPRPSEVAAHLGEDVASVVEALTADGCYTATSLDVPIGDGSACLGDVVGADDRALQSADARLMLDPVLRGLGTRDRRILHLRFYEERSQQQIADDVGLTQSQVSRILEHILSELRADLDEKGTAA